MIEVYNKTINKERLYEIYKGHEPNKRDIEMAESEYSWRHIKDFIYKLQYKSFLCIEFEKNIIVYCDYEKDRYIVTNENLDFSTFTKSINKINEAVKKFKIKLRKGG